MWCVVRCDTAWCGGVVCVDLLVVCGVGGDRLPQLTTCLNLFLPMINITNVKGRQVLQILHKVFACFMTNRSDCFESALVGIEENS